MTNRAKEAIPPARSKAKSAVEAASRSGHPFLSTPEEIIEEARNGRMFVLVDDEDRENEGDLVIPAQMATPDAVNFMATHGRGLVCLALTKDRVDQLGLTPMAGQNGARPDETAFTVSIEARTGVDTGISAADRARTVAVAIDASKGPDQIVTPGHVFPLVARPGGVLVRAGHAEAAVDVARLAGLNPSGVVCGIMNDDGNMAQLDELVAFSQRHKLKLGTIRDLIAYRRRHDRLIERILETPFDSEFGGDWNAITYRNRIDETEHLVLQKGRIDPDKPTIVRMHAISLFDDMLGRTGARLRILERSMRVIGEAGSGLIVILRPQGPRELSTMMSTEARDQEMDLRSYGVGAQILADLGVHDMVLLTNVHRNLVAIEGYGISVVGEQSI
ncbi:MAG TPA: 3,4-dihydroxy-2-butanone-4-phosphate synthase [Sphingobium sp.]|nr:3,4-dihydroxy-2-butanone-4-phosphate synthase [Sphingobium sp.]